MTIAERILTLDDAALLRLQANARRLEATPGSQQHEAARLVPLIDAEVAERLARKPPKTVAKRAAKPKAAKPEAAKVVEAALDA
jgi:hypothetical protein